LVETRKRILSKAKLALRPMTILASLTRRQGSSINVPLRGTPLTPLRLAELEVCIEPYKKTLDNADDVIHRTWRTELAKCIPELGRYQSTSARVLLHTSRHPSDVASHSLSLGLGDGLRLRIHVLHQLLAQLAHLRCGPALRRQLQIGIEVLEQSWRIVRAAVNFAQQ